MLRSPVFLRLENSSPGRGYNYLSEDRRRQHYLTVAEYVRLLLAPAGSSPEPCSLPLWPCRPIQSSPRYRQSQGSYRCTEDPLSLWPNPLADLFQTLSPIAASLTGLETKLVSVAVSLQCCSRAKIEKSSSHPVLYHSKVYLESELVLLAVKVGRSSRWRANITQSMA